MILGASMVDGWTQLALPAGSVIVGGFAAAIGARWSAKSLRRREAMAEMILGIPRITIDLEGILSAAETNSHTTLFLLEGDALDRINKEIERLRFLGKAFAPNAICSTTESVASKFRNFDSNIRSSSGPGDLKTGKFESDEAELRTSLADLERILERRLRRRFS